MTQTSMYVGQGEYGIINSRTPENIRHFRTDELQCCLCVLAFLRDGKMLIHIDGHTSETYLRDLIGRYRPIKIYVIFNTKYDGDEALASNARKFQPILMENPETIFELVETDYENIILPIDIEQLKKKDIEKGEMEEVKSALTPKKYRKTYRASEIIFLGHNRALPLRNCSEVYPKIPDELIALLKELRAKSPEERRNFIYNEGKRKWNLEGQKQLIGAWEAINEMLKYRLIVDIYLVCIFLGGGVLLTFLDLFTSREEEDEERRKKVGKK
jgi:hypothetical protein